MQFGNLMHLESYIWLESFKDVVNNKNISQKGLTKNNQRHTYLF